MGKEVWKTGRDLVDAWQIQPVELLCYLAEGLTAYTKLLRKIVDVTKAERRPKYTSDDEAMAAARPVFRNRITITAWTIDGGEPEPYKDPREELRDLARSLREETVPIVPDNTEARDFRLPLDEKEAQAKIDEAMDYRFKLSEAEAFGQSHELPSLLPKDKTHAAKTSQDKLRPSQLHREACRAVAKALWEQDPTITIREMGYRDEINKLLDGKPYNDATFRQWFKDLCPNRSPGRRRANATLTDSRPTVFRLPQKTFPQNDKKLQPTDRNYFRGFAEY